MRRRLGGQQRAARWCTWGAWRAGPGAVREQGRRRERRGRGANGGQHGGRCGYAVRGEQRRGSRGVRARGACPSVWRRPGVRAGREQAALRGAVPRLGALGVASGVRARVCAQPRVARRGVVLGQGGACARGGVGCEVVWVERAGGAALGGARGGAEQRREKEEERGGGKKKRKERKMEKGKIKRKGGERERKEREGGIRAAISAPGRPRAGSGTRARSGASRGSRANRERAGVRNRTLGTGKDSEK